MVTSERASVPAVEISLDRLSVTLKADEEHEQNFTPDEMISHLRALGIVVSEPELIEAMADAEGRVRTTEDIKLLEGRAPEPEIPATLELLVRPPAPETTSSYYEGMAYLTTSPGQPIARISPEVPGRPGLDVCGNPISFPRSTAPPLDFGENVEIDEDGVTVRATSVGRIRQEGRSIWVETAIEVNGDVNFSCCNIAADGDVHVRGSVLDLFKVKGNNIYVGGAIEGAEVNAVGDLHVAGGIAGKDKGYCTVGGHLTCKYLTNISVKVGGDIDSRGTIANARIICGGRVIIERGALASGHTNANGGVTCRSLGSPTSDKTLVEVGFDEALRSTAKSKLHQIQMRRKKAANIRDMVAQMHQHSKKLTQLQTRQVESLEAEATATEAACDELFEELRSAYATAQEKKSLEVAVQGVLHPGVTIRFPGVETLIETPWKGPLSIVPRQDEEGNWSIVMIDSKNESEHVLESRPWSDAALIALDAAMAE